MPNIPYSAERCPRFVYDCNDDGYNNLSGTRADYPCLCGKCDREGSNDFWKHVCD